MITCKLGDKTYTVDFIAGRALREMGPALKVYSQIAKALAGEEEAAEKPIELADGLDVLVKWFCLIFGNQFTPEDVYDGYPADRLVEDIVLAMLAVQSQTTEVLKNFPTTPAQKRAPVKAKTTGARS